MALFKIAPAALVAVICAAAPAAAAPVGPAIAPAAVKSGSAVTEVQYRGGWRGYRRGGYGRGIALGLGAAIVGGVIANEIYRPRAGYYYDDYAYDGPYYRPSRYAGDGRTLCAENFRSFEWDTGLYTTYGGEKRVCP
jgi:opacity protein-like surface antigen